MVHLNSVLERRMWRAPVGLAAAVTYLRNQDQSAIERHEAQLTQYALDRLSDIPGLRVLGPKEAAQRLPVFSFVLANCAPPKISSYLDAQGIAFARVIWPRCRC